MLIIAEDPGNQIPAEQKHRTKACKAVTAEARYIPFQEKPGHDEWGLASFDVTFYDEEGQVGASARWRFTGKDCLPAAFRCRF